MPTVAVFMLKIFMSLVVGITSGRLGVELQDFPDLAEPVPPQDGSWPGPGKGLPGSRGLWPGSHGQPGCPHCGLAYD